MLTEIQTTFIMLFLWYTLWSGNGGCTPYCGLTSDLLLLRDSNITSRNTHQIPPASQANTINAETTQNTGLLKRDCPSPTGLCPSTDHQRQAIVTRLKCRTLRLIPYWDHFRRHVDLARSLCRGHPRDVCADPLDRRPTPLKVRRTLAPSNASVEKCS